MLSSLTKAGREQRVREWLQEVPVSPDYSGGFDAHKPSVVRSNGDVLSETCNKDPFGSKDIEGIEEVEDHESSFTRCNEDVLSESLHECPVACEDTEGFENVDCTETKDQSNDNLPEPCGFSACSLLKSLLSKPKVHFKAGVRSARGNLQERDPGMQLLPKIPQKSSQLRVREWLQKYPVGRESTEGVEGHEPFVGPRCEEHEPFVGPRCEEHEPFAASRSEHLPSRLNKPCAPRRNEEKTLRVQSRREKEKTTMPEKISEPCATKKDEERRLLFRSKREKRNSIMPGEIRPYSVEEMSKIIIYIIENDVFPFIKGSVLWKQMEKDKVCDRTWQSMRSQFIHKIYPKIDTFPLLAEDKATFDKYMKTSEITESIYLAPGQRGWRRNANYYTKSEDLAILKYITKEPRIGLTHGKVLWVEMEQRKVLPGRSWQSMRFRYFHSIYRSLEEFGLKKAVIERLRGVKRQEDEEGSSSSSSPEKCSPLKQQKIQQRIRKCAVLVAANVASNMKKSNVVDRVSITCQSTEPMITDGSGEKSTATAKEGMNSNTCAGNEASIEQPENGAMIPNEDLGPPSSSEAVCVEPMNKDGACTLVADESNPQALKTHEMTYNQCT